MQIKFSQRRPSQLLPSSPSSSSSSTGASSSPGVGIQTICVDVLVAPAMVTVGMMTSYPSPQNVSPHTHTHTHTDPTKDPRKDLIKGLAKSQKKKKKNPTYRPLITNLPMHPQNPTPPTINLTQHRAPKSHIHRPRRDAMFRNTHPQIRRAIADNLFSQPLHRGRRIGVEFGGRSGSGCGRVGSGRGSRGGCTAGSDDDDGDGGVACCGGLSVWGGGRGCCLGGGLTGIYSPSTSSSSGLTGGSTSSAIGSASSSSSRLLRSRAGLTRIPWHGCGSCHGMRAWIRW